MDGVFIGESEKTIIEVLEAGDNQDALSKINGFGYRLDDIFFINKNLNLVVDVDEIPYPAYDLLPLNKYKEFMGKNIFSILTSRSCPFACSFCSGYLYSGRGQRRRNIDKVIEEIEWLKYQYGAEFLWIRDENFNVNKNHAKGLLKEMIDKKINIPWLDTNGFHVNSVDEEFLDLVKSSDCNEIIFAVESGSERVLKEIMKKNVNLEHAKKMAEHCRKIGLVVQCYFVIGNPGETKEEIMQTIELAKEMKVDHCTFSLATPFPGTEYYDIAVKKKYLVHDTNYILSMKYMEANMETENFTPEWLKDTQYDANIRVNFLENKNLYFSKETQEKSLEYYGRVYQQYNFHAIAHLIEGYLEGKQGNYSRQNFIFNEVREALKEENISKAYAKYIYWNTAPTNCYRQWLELQNI